LIKKDHRDFAVPYPAAFLNDEKEFIARIATRVPSLRAHFKECEDIYPEDRPEKLDALAARHTPHIWDWVGIEPARQQSYAAINGTMAKIAFMHPHDDYDLPAVMRLIRVTHLPEIIAGDINGHGLTKDEIDNTRALAMRYMLGGFATRKLWDDWHAAIDPRYGDAQWTRDLRRIAMAAIAAEHRPGASPDVAARIGTLICALTSGLETDHGRAVMDRIMGRPDAPRTERDARRTGFHSGP
jgi:hypothetical protein